VYTLVGKINGIVPILFNRFRGEASEGHSPGGKITKKDMEAMVGAKVHRDANGLYLPAQNLKMAIVGGQKSRGAAMIVGSEIEKRKGGAYTDWCKACLFIQPERLYFHKDTWDHIDDRWAKNEKQQLVRAIRPALREGWEVKFKVEVVDDAAKEDWVKRFCEVAGLRVGVGSYRPDFGRFLVEWNS